MLISLPLAISVYIYLVLHPFLIFIWIANANSGFLLLLTYYFYYFCCCCGVFFLFFLVTKSPVTYLSNSLMLCTEFLCSSFLMFILRLLLLPAAYLLGVCAYVSVYLSYVRLQCVAPFFYKYIHISFFLFLFFHFGLPLSFAALRCGTLFGRFYLPALNSLDSTKQFTYAPIQHSI